MPKPPTAEPDPSKPDLSATGVLRAQPGDPRLNNARFETDFSQLAACFAQSGSGLSPELSTALALEIVLNEVVEQACLTTGATGAAIALERDGEMVCRASSGATSPALGSRLDAASGLSGECIRTRRTQRCDDVLADTRVDHEASQRLGVRSVMIMPLVRGTELVGLFELFSSLPRAFGERDERTLEALAVRVLSSLERADQPLPPPENEPALVSEALEIVPEIPDIAIPESSAESSAPESLMSKSAPESGIDWATWALRVAVLVFAVLLGLLLGRHPETPKAMVRPRPVGTQAGTGNPSAASNPAADTNTSRKQDAVSVQPSASVSATGKTKAVPPGSLLVFENGKEIFRLPPGNEAARTGAPTQTELSSSGEGSGVQLASSAEPENSNVPSSAPAEGSLIHRVEPEYPQDALEQKLQGAVVLEVHIGRDGAVQDVNVVSGPPELAQASIDAVMQWRFKPRRVRGGPAPMQTTITLNFRLPQ
jgi:TonB family protein